MEIGAIPLPGTEVTHPELLLASGVVLAATVVFWLATGRRRGDDGAGDSRRGRRGRRRPRVTVNVDPGRCARFGYCEHEAPHVFQVRREGRLTYQDRVRVDEIDPVVRAVEVCPTRAISLGRMPRGD